MRSLNDAPMFQRVSPVVLRLQRLGRKTVVWIKNARDLPLPRFRTIAAGLLGSTAIYGMVLGSHTTAVIDAVAEPLGLSIDTVDVTGYSETSEIDVLQTLWMAGAQTLPALDVTAAREAIEAMPWIESATIEKEYPNRVKIALVEKKPFALWQRDKDLWIVDHDGREIVPYATTRFTDLPFVVGPGAAREAADILDKMALVPELDQRIRAYVRVGDRRWDLRLDNGVVIRLPELDPIEAAATVMRVDRNEGLLARDIVSVDMRLADRMVVKLTPAAKERWDKVLKERDKLWKQAQKEKPV
ncbi:cell division protein FtsQ/DivIB [Aureimonas phyllosphaerae]|uniref:Cell division protein FtsQ n=1 Tax=Aureimonas phyllosphaerae TaxID=1166078 RepID=A0A7W6FT51_9HYPH|nr:cell division protein FtsQ/DivIB [Aureimonas phyllosphaerae]MBB3934365.1 cell division protein FtsQ [Aureimonas phyllosphaerae]MBB3958419.1 cell division protein FtsQ [Aureimonas phyllosphaerae]SFE96708.1 cell division protein FtsQ [Aureimonas phyllosphaerae]